MIFLKNTLKTLMLGIIWFLFKHSEHLCEKQKQTVRKVLYYSHCPCEKLHTPEAAMILPICPLTSHRTAGLCKKMSMSTLFAKTCSLLSSCQLLFQNKWNLKISLFLLFKASTGCSSGGQKVTILIYPCAAALRIFNL